ncbi:MAG: acetyl-CoA carboxylase carboxyl transferase subunit beta, partial [Acetobacteraceae bacterium]
MLHTLELKQHHQTCHHCDHHFLMDAHDRIALLADPDSFEETEKDLVSANPLGFTNYREKIEGMRAKT